jgi:hypothetical protein
MTVDTPNPADVQPPQQPVQQAQPVYPPPPAPVQYAQQPVYSQPPVYAPQPHVYGQPMPPPTGECAVVSTGGWLGTLILMAIPVIGFIMCVVWAFGGGNLNRRNFARACLIIWAVFIVLGIIIGVAAAAMLQGAIGPYLDQIRGMSGGAL